MRRLASAGCVLLAVVLVTACTAKAPNPATTTGNSDHAQTTMPDAATTVVPGSAAAELANATSKAVFASAPAVILISDQDTAALDGAAKAAVGLGVPLLLTPAAGPVDPSASASPTVAAVAATAEQEGVAAEIARLHARVALTMDDAAASWVHSADPGVPVVSNMDDPAVHGVQPGSALSSLLVVALSDPASAAAVATARASGAHVVTLANADPRATSDSVKAIAGASIDRVLAIGSAFGTPDVLRQRLTIAKTGVELPGGGQLLFPGRHMVALYGHPGDTVLGSLGEQPLDATIARAKQVAAQYAPLVNEPVVPAFEIIVTVASSSAGADGNYSSEFPVETFKPWVQAARDAGIYVVLDLQPGRSDFLSQAKLYTELLQEPNVGLALDPEWRLKPDQVHMVQIGSVSAEEINATGQWLDQLTRDHNLPQKVFLLHQFRLDMITNRAALVTNYDNLRVLIHVDGFGTPGQKFDTWNTLHIDAPANIVWGWKNFYDEDKPTFTPEQTMQVSPQPVFVSYQ